MNVVTALLLFFVALAHGLGAQTVRVWVNTKSHVYHCPGTRYYQGTKSGRLMPEKEARSAGNRPAYGTACGPLEDSPQLALGLAGATKSGTTPSAERGAGTVKVWVNTNSHVYHCLGTRYFGKTKNGRYMSQAEARGDGNRPAYGTPCSR